MKSVLLIKTGAAGDVIRTTTLLHVFSSWHTDWFVSPSNAELLDNGRVRNVFFELSDLRKSSKYDLVISLEDDFEILESVISSIKYVRLQGSFAADGSVNYTSEFSKWFDLSLVSKLGIENANEMKLKNRISYQEHLFAGFNRPFRGEPYILPNVNVQSDLTGDIAIAPQSGKRWPMKNWAFFESLVDILSKTYKVNILPERDTMLEHIADISGHSLVVSGDSLPMHIAMGLKIPCIALFICTSPWEIYDYGVLEKFISPKLHEYFYRRDIVPSASTSISLESVLVSIHKKLRN
jgi:heptosyltransferase-2